MTEQDAVADFARAVAVLVADRDKPIEAHVTTLAAAWALLAAQLADRTRRGH